MQCKFCNLVITNNGNLSKHENACSKFIEFNKDILDDYLVSFLSIKKLRKKYNISYPILKNILGSHKRTLSQSMKIAHKLYSDNFKHTEETKNKLRIRRLEFMKNNPEKTAWRKSNMSYAEKIIFNELNKCEEYIIEREKSFYPFFADFTILNANVVIEIDGKQHKLPERVISDYNKNELIISKGYRIIRFEAIEVIKSVNTVIEKLKQFVSGGTLYFKSDYIYEPNKYICKCGSEKTRISKICHKCNSFKNRKVLDRPQLQELLELSETLGYVKTGKLYNVSDNTIRKWIKQYNTNNRNYSLLAHNKDNFASLTSLEFPDNLGVGNSEDSCRSNIFIK